MQYGGAAPVFGEIGVGISGISRRASADRPDTVRALCRYIVCYAHRVWSRNSGFLPGMRDNPNSGCGAFRAAQVGLYMLFRVLIVYFAFILLQRARVGLGGSFEIG